MQTYTFTLVLCDQAEVTEGLAEALAAAGCHAAWVKIETQDLVGAASD
ncbi:MAG: hypothetical protein HQ567_29725 [Candidatus Nealsonbacteria bacterium]|nr:hypothetical protein [Candidatus Nealsonbacteria bacterium]